MIMPCRRIFLGFLAALLAFAAPCRAQDQNNGTLHVLRPVIHAEQEAAELCLEFDHDLDPADHARIASLIRLESGGKALPVKPQNVSVASSLLCLPSLAHHKVYRVVIAGLRGAKGEKLAGPYSLVFTVPDRQSSLTFSGDAGGLRRWEDGDPVLRALNVPRARIELYRITDPALMAEAWRGRQQTTLAPSESATFGRDHGQNIWSGDLALGDVSNGILEQTVPLHAAVKEPPPGLYLIVARAPEAKTETGGLAVTGAAWLLRSGLRLRALRVPGGFYALAEKLDATSAMKDIRLLVEDANGQMLAEGKSDDGGVGFLPLPDDKKNAAAVLVGLTDKGDADFADLKARAADRFIFQKNQASLTLDKPFYSPGDTASVTLASHDEQGRAVSEAGTALRLVHPGDGVYASFPVPADAAATHVTFPVPAAAGIWPLVWQREGDGTLAEASLHVTSSPDAPHIEASADRAVLPADGGVKLTLKSLTNDGRPAPYMAGRIFVAWMVPDNIFREWPEYRFGVGGHPASDATPVASFVTDDKGGASFRLALAPPDDHSLLHSAVLSVRSDAAAGPAPLTLPMKPREDIIGIRPLAPEGRFPENGLAHFNVIALNADGHRRGADDLAWQVYEEGRSFEWYQAEGRWNYRPLQQKRRMGGGTLTLAAEGEDIVEWPVAAGTYRLEITDANGNVRTSVGFSAGWGLPDVPASPSPLALAPADAALKPGQETRVRFTLDRPAMVAAFIGDDRMRKVIHRFMPQGENAIVFTPEKDWGARVGVRVEAGALDQAGQVTLPLARDAPETAKPEAPKDISSPEDLMIDAAFPSVLTAGDSARVALDLRNSGKAAARYRYSLSAAPGLKITDAGAGSVNLPAGQSGRILFTLNASRPGVSTVRLELTGPSRFHASRDWTVSVVAGDAGFGAVLQQRLEPQQSWPAMPLGAANEKQHAKNEDSVLFLAAAPLFDTPSLLAGMIGAPSFTTEGIAGTLETLRLWREAIIVAGLLPEPALEARRQDLLLRLLARQKPDGGFPPMPESPADFVSTSQALMALAHAAQPVARPGMEQAVSWLRHRLENTWFDEHERPERAAAYAALAEADRLDNASLHYFGDTSADKALPALAAAQLALAFAKTGDRDRTFFWLAAAGVWKNANAIPAPLLPILAGNSSLDPRTLWSSLEAVSKTLSHDSESMTGFLRAMSLIQTRKGSWRVTVGTDKRNPKDILVISFPAKSILPVIHDTGGDPVFLVKASGAAAPSTAAKVNAITRHIYQLNGTETGGHKPLDRSETYLIVLEGPWLASETAGPVFLHDDPAPALRATGCLPPAPVEADDSLAWLKSQTLTPLSACETWNGSIDVLMTRKENSAASWRMAYLARAEWGGVFALAPATARAFAAGGEETMKTQEGRVNIR